MRKIILIFLIISISFSYFFRYTCYKEYCSAIFYGNKNECYEINSNSFVYPKKFCLYKYRTKPLLIIAKSDIIFINITKNNETIYYTKIKIKRNPIEYYTNPFFLANIPVFGAAIYSLYRLIRES